MGGKPKVPKAKSAFDGIKTYQTNLSGLANTTSNRGVTTTTLDKGLTPALSAAKLGLGNNLSLTAQNPTQQLADLNAGRNSFYNLQAELDRRNAEKATEEAQIRYSLGGLQNSTSRGAFEGQIARDALLQDLATRKTSLEYLNNQANQNIATQYNVLNGLAGIMSGNSSATQGQWMQAQQGADQMRALNAKMQFDAAQAEAQRRSQMIGNMINAAATVGGAALTGGGSLALQGAMKGLGGMFNRGEKLASTGNVSNYTSQLFNPYPISALGTVYD